MSGEEKRFRDIAADLTVADLQGELRYARGRDKGDKSLEIYKFYINALYVAVTRAVRNLYLIEPRPTQPLLTLLGLTDVRQAVDDVEEQRSSLEEWRREAHRLELQGKDEQAAEIRGQILKQQPIPWTVLRGDALTALRAQALEKGDKKARIALMEYALVYRDQRLLNALNQAGLQAARHPDKAWPTLEKKHYLLYTLKNPGGVLREADKYGVDFRNCFGQTPLMIASRMGNADLIEQLLERDADVNLTDGNGLNAFQIALDRACADERFARIRLPAVFERLAPPSLDIQVDGRLVKLDRRLMEYLMLSVALVLFYQRLGENWVTRRKLLSAIDFATVLEHFPESVVPARRKKRPYVSSILSKNEAGRDGPYNRKLFLRMEHGQYLINPLLALRVEGEWRAIYDLLVPDRLDVALREQESWWREDWNPNTYREKAIAQLRGMIADLPKAQGRLTLNEPRVG